TRARLTALIAAVLVGCGALLLGVQYLAVQGLLRGPAGGSADSAEWAALSEPAAGSPVETSEPEAAQEAPDSAGAGRERSGEAADEAPDETPRVSDGLDAGGLAAEEDSSAESPVASEVLPALALWSAGALLVFAVLAILIARWLSRRSFHRVAQITALAQRITAGDLDERIELGGRRDEVRELADTIDGMLDRLQEAFAQQGRFIANASHELRTPLTTTRTALEIPLAQGRVPESLEPAIRRALAANEKSERLVSALLALARVRGGGPADGGGRTIGADLRRVVLAALESRGARAAELGVEMALDGLAGDAGSGSGSEPGSGSESSWSARVAADPALVELAVDNLVGNAVRHNVLGGYIRVSLRDGGGKLRLRIENTGAQLDERTAAALVEPFNRGDATRLADGDGEPGLGLGLTLADEAARACGGSLALAPRPGGGLVATLSLPIERKERS
ncbi:MAG: HAMP domain-containing sensor histidine kinase, partial [Leucobacter sp.]